MLTLSRFAPLIIQHPVCVFYQWLILSSLGFYQHKKYMVTNVWSIFPVALVQWNLRMFATTWEIGTTWQLRTATAVPKSIQYTEMDLRNNTTSEWRTVFHSPLGVPNSWIPRFHCIPLKLTCVIYYTAPGKKINKLMQKLIFKHAKDNSCQGDLTALKFITTNKICHRMYPTGLFN